jgi:hypothetical protein
MGIIAIRNCNTLAMMQREIQNSGNSLDIRTEQVYFELVLEIRE